MNAFKEWRRQQRKKYKLLIKQAKDFDSYDYGFMDDLVFTMVEMYYDRFSNKDITIIDEESPFYKEMILHLKRAVDLIHKCKEIEDYNPTMEEYSKYRHEIYNIIAEYSGTWWE